MPNEPRQLTFDWTDIERTRIEPRALFDHPEADRLTTLPEGQHFERKGPLVKPRDLAATISAFSNSDARGGLIVIGVENKVLKGFGIADQPRLAELMNAQPTFCPQALCRQRTAELKGETVLLLLVEYHAHRVVEVTDGTVYLRFGSTNRRLAPEEVVRLRHDKGEVPFELELVSDATFADLDSNLVGEYAESVRAADDLQFNRDLEDLLIQKRLARIEGGRLRPFNAALLLFGRDPLRHFPGCKVRFIRYEGTEERTGKELNVVKDVVVEGPIPTLIKRAAEVASSQLREFRALREDGRFELLHEYPQDCVYEAIVNACVHRSYAARNMNVFVRMFDDRLEVESPGGFLPPVTPQNIYDQHVPRNPIIMDALRYLRFVRCANEGTRRMRHLMETSGLPHPVFRQSDDRMSKVVVMLRNNIEQRKTWIDRDLAHLGEAVARSLSPAELRVLNYLAEFKQITVSHTQRITGVKTWHSAKKILEALVKKGVVRAVSTKLRDPKAHWVLTEPWQTNGTKPRNGGTTP